MIFTVATYMLMLGLAMLVALFGVVAYRRLRAGRANPPGHSSEANPAAERRSGGGGEHQASAAAEVLESIIQRRMAGEPALAGQRLDFGTASDGSIEIWWNGQAYPGVDQVPDPRVRDLIAQATDEFNQGGGVSG